jgi:hypothetical protein
MPVRFEYRENNRVAFYAFSDPWETHEFVAHYPADNAYRASVKHTIHTFMDLTGARSIPTNILRARTKAPAWSHANSGVIVMVGAIPLAKSVAGMVFKIARFNRAKFFNTADEGWAYLRQLIAEEESVMVAGQHSAVENQP